MATIAELILEQGRQQANERQRQGDIRGSMWQNLANIAAQYGKNVQQQQIEAPIRAQEAQMRGLQIQNAQEELGSRRAATAHDAAFRDAIQSGVPDEELVKIDPERADKFIAGRDAVVKGKQQGYMDRQRILADTTLGLEAVPEDIRADAYTQKRKELIDNKIIAPADAPEQFDPVWFASTLAHAKKLNPQKTREVKTKDATGAETTQIVEDKPGQSFQSAPELPKTPEEQQLEAFAKSLGKAGRSALTYEDYQAFQSKKDDAAFQKSLKTHMAERNYDAAHPLKEAGPDQTKLEQNYRTVLQRAMSSRSGGIGLEDAKVQQANHLISVLDQFYDPKSGTWSIPRVQLNELALGLARLTSPGGQAGEGMLREFQQRTAAGDVAGALTYLTGQPVAANTQAITAMLKDSIERQGKTAEQNREGEMRYLRGLAPTELEESRRQALEANSLNPLRQSRVIENPKTKDRKLQVSIDGGKTWQ